MSNFSHSLLSWYSIFKRDLPWRETQDPYKIWLSEIILQQTRVDQGLPYYHRFIDNFPNINALASAELDEILHLWQGLGYYSRARNLHQTAIEIVQKHGGYFPGSYQDLLKLKGIGPYTAAAIASFAYHEAVPVVDGNVFRVLARHFALEEDIAKPASRKVFTSLAHQLMPSHQAGLFNQAIMEFGALQCTPQKPNCNSCPMQVSCLAFAQNKVDSLPFKAKKTAALEVNWHFIAPTGPNLLMEQRPNKGIWAGLFCLAQLPNQLIDRYHSVPEALAAWLDVEAPLDQPEPIILSHLLTHRKIKAHFWICKPITKLAISQLSLISKQDWKKVAMPKLMTNFLEEFIQNDN